MRNEPMSTNDMEATNILVMNGNISQKPLFMEREADTNKGKGKEVTLVLKSISRPHTPFP